MAVHPRESRLEKTPQALLDVVRTLAAELSPRLDVRDVTLDSSLSDELGLDSLSRMELMLRLERTFGVALPEETLFGAETPRDLLAALQRAQAPLGPIFSPAALPEASQAGFPRQARTLVETLAWHVQAHPERPHLYVLTEDATEVVSYESLWWQAAKVAGGLRASGLQPAERVGLMLPTSRAYFSSFYGILLAGGVPVPIYPPFRLAGIEDHLRRQTRILANAESRLLVAPPEARRFARMLKAHVPSVQAVLTPAELARAGAIAPAEPTANDLALLQYTSGSTGQPKGVMLTHANLLANIRAMGQAVRASADDVFVSWLPLYHDMGLIGAWLSSLYHGIPLVVMPPTTFLAHPDRWLWAIHHYRGTLSAAPNFAYEIAARKIDPELLENLDLASWRRALNGAEPVSPTTLARFAQRFAAHGFRPEALAPVYGLAESAVGLAFPPPERGPVIDAVQREPLTHDGRATPAAPGDPHALRYVACGQPLPGHQIRIVDEAGRELPERVVGRLEFSGPSCTSGYFHNPEQTRALIHGRWLDSGDMAYIAGGDIYLTGRVKDLVIVAGRNMHPYELEEAVGDLPGVRKGCVAVFGSLSVETGTERLVVVAETRETDLQRLAELRARIVQTVQALWEIAPDDVALVPPHSVPKTSSGKIRRGDCRDLYEHGQLMGGRPSWRLFAPGGLIGVGPALRRARHRMGADLYAAYAWICFGLLALPVWLAVALLPVLAWRRQVVKAAGKLLLRLLRMPLYVEGLERLPARGPDVLVCNHASYLDTLMLTAALPIEIRYVAMRSFERHFLTRIFMERLDTLFVERDDPHRGVADTGPLTTALRQGDRLLIFPEGGFGRAPGLRPFHMGAFVVAAQAHVPVVPVALWGTRSLLREQAWYARPGAAHLTVGEPIPPQGDGWDEALRLRRLAYAEVLRHCGEPALGGEPAP